MLLLFCAFPVFGFNPADSTRSDYIQRYNDYFFIGPVIKKRNLAYSIHPVSDPGEVLEFEANSGASIGLSMNLFEVGVEAAVSIPAGAKSQSIYGESNISDLQLTAIGKEWFADAYLQSYEGFYNASEKVLPGMPRPQRADVVTRNYGVSFAYIFDHRKFSLRSAYTFTEAQKKSRGSFLLSYILSSFTLQADSSLVPQTAWESWGEGASFNEVRFTSLGLAPGYSHNFVLKNFFANLTLAIGPAHYWTRYKLSESAARNDIRINVYSLGRIGIGYNKDNFFTGLQVVSQARDLRFEDVRFNSSMTTVRFILGFRFLERGVLKQRAIDYTPFASLR